MPLTQSHPRRRPATPPVTGPLGTLAGTDEPHPYRPHTCDQCGDCWGWYDDVRHWVRAR